MTAAQACPFCNASVAVSGSPGRRLTCPRCGETFAPFVSEAVQKDDVVAISSSVPSAAPTPEIDRYLGRQSDPRGRNRRLALIVLAVMIAMAGTGLTYALLTQAQRRTNDAGLPGKLKDSQAGSDVAETPPGPVPADQMPLLGYVPDGSNILLGVHIAELRRDRLGRELLDKKISLGSFISLPLDIAPWTGLDKEDVDYALLTANLTPNVLRGEFSLALLVHCRRAVDEAEIVRRLQATKEIPLRKDAPTWKFRPQGQKMDWSLRFVNPHMLALGILPGHLTAIPTEARQGLGHLSESLRTAVTRIETGGVLWLAATLDPPTRDMLLGPGGGAGKESRAPLKTVQTLVAWVRPGSPFTLSAMFQCADGAGAEKLRDYLAGVDPNLHEPELKLAIGDGAWLSVQRRADLATVLQTIDKGLKH